MIDVTKPTGRRAAARGFTLVELLVVIALLAILSGMVMTAVQGVTTSARMARTRSIIATVDSVIQEHYQSYLYRPFAIHTPDGGFVGPAGTLTHEVLPSEAARVRLIMTRDLQRMELPDRVSDVRQASNRRLATQPVVITAVADRVIERPDGRLVLQRREQSGDLEQRTQGPVTWFGGSPGNTTTNERGDWPTRFSAYLRRTSATNPDGTIRWTAQHQGAECLYLILATTFSNGVSAIESIPSSNIGDTDGDGVPEILDGWGRPLGFIRWPVGFADPEVSLGIVDEFDPFRSDFRYALPGIPNPFSVRPLIISAGADAEFGIAFSPRRFDLFTEDRALAEPQLVSEEVNYATQTWPVSEFWMGREVGGRSRNFPYFFPDPFLRQYIAATEPARHLVPGESLEGSDARSWRADNISNYQLQATQ